MLVWMPLVSYRESCHPLGHTDYTSVNDTGEERRHDEL